MSLKEWFGKGPKGDWVDIGAPKKGGKFQACGRKSASKSKRAYPKCVPRSKAKSMTAAERKSAVARKRAKPQGVGGKPTNVATFKRKKSVKRKCTWEAWLRQAHRIKIKSWVQELCNKTHSKA